MPALNDPLNFSFVLKSPKITCLFSFLLMVTVECNFLAFSTCSLMCDWPGHAENIPLMSALEWKEEENVSLLIYQFLFKPKDLQILPILEYEWKMSIWLSLTPRVWVCYWSVINRCFFPHLQMQIWIPVAVKGMDISLWVATLLLPTTIQQILFSPLLPSTSWKFAGSNG